MPQDDEIKFMRRAIEKATESQPEDDPAHPLVGALTAVNGRVIDLACRCETGLGDHAEEGLLETIVAGRGSQKWPKKREILTECQGASVVGERRSRRDWMTAL